MSAPSTHATRRAFGPGARRLVIYSLGGLVLATAITASYATLRSGEQPTRPGAATPGPSGAASSGSNATYGTIPSWLPNPSVPVGRVVQASAAHPWLAIEGDTVVVHLAHGTATVTAVGPAVPTQGQFPLPTTSRCTFVVTFARAVGVVPIAPHGFTIIDERGHLHHPTVQALFGPHAPTSVPPGGLVSIRLEVVLPAGNGQLRWAPDGTTPIVSWDFNAEFD